MKTALVFATLLYGVAGVAGLVLAATELASLIGPTANLSASAVLGWYLYYDTRFGKPALQRQHLDEMAKLQTAFIREAERIREDAQQQAGRLGEFYAKLLGARTPGRRQSNDSSVVDGDAGPEGSGGDSREYGSGGSGAS